MIKRNEFTPITERGTRGEAVYRLKTAPTDITVDGIRDSAYDEGIHLCGIFTDDEAYYKDRSTNIELYVTRCKDGRLYFFGSVTDPDIVVKEEFFNGRVDDCDNFKVFLNTDEIGLNDARAIRVIPYLGSVPYNRMPPDTKVVMTDKGFDFEFSLDNGGSPFKEGDRIAFAAFYFDNNGFKSDLDFKRHVIKLPMSLDALASEFPAPVYCCPSIAFYDTILISDLSPEDEKTPAKDLSGNMLRDILQGGATVAVVAGGKYPALQTLWNAVYIHRHLRSLGVDSTFIGNTATDNGISYDYEIVFNNSTAAKNPLFYSLECDEWGIESVGNRIFVSAPLEKGAAAAKERLIAIIDEAKSGAFPEKISERGKETAEVITEFVPKPDRFDLIHDVGDDAYMYLSLDAEADELAAYRTALDANGFSLYTENSFGCVKTYTYVGHGAVITVVFAENCDGGVHNSLRIVVEPLSKTALPMLSPAPYEKKRSPKLTMMGFVGLCLVYRLESGEFVILDGGCAHQYQLLYDYLMAESDGKPVVAAWLFSHFHQDHAGVFARLTDTNELIKNVKIKSIVYNFPQKMLCDTALNSNDQANLRKWNHLLEKTGATVYQARTGQKFYFEGMEIELLWTFEDLIPYNILKDDTNPTCVAYRVTYAGETYMLLGDSSEDELRGAYKRLGSYLKSDAVQLAHHGKGSSNTPPELYKLIDAETVLIPGPEAGRIAEKWAAANAKRVYDNRSGNVELDLPIKR